MKSRPKNPWDKTVSHLSSMLTQVRKWEPWDRTHTSPSSRRSLKLRLLTLSCGELGKQCMQSVNV
jgi:hypothetical protein